MSLTTCQCSWILSNSSPVMVVNDKTNDVRSTNFAQISSWISLKSSQPSLRTHKLQQGLVENLHLTSLAKQGKLREAHEFIKSMDAAGISIYPRSYEYLFKMCGKLGALSDGKTFHNRLQRMANSNKFIDNCILQMYCDCRSFTAAERFFDEMIHSLLMKIGLAADISMEMSLSNMYVKCGWLDGAKVAINEMTEKNAVACTAWMVGYTRAERHMNALILFAKMISEGVKLDEFVFSIVFKACAALGDLNTGKKIHGYSGKLGLESKVSVGTPIVDFYVKCARFEAARQAFERISEPNDFSWSAIIIGYCQNGRFDRALEIFKTVRSKGVSLNSFIYTNIFQACSAVSDLIYGAQVHEDAIKKGLIARLTGESSMITMYSNCGKVDYAHQAFLAIDKPDTVAWSAIICAYAYDGKASESTRLFNEMQESGVRPNALEIIKGLPFEPDAMSWKSLLGGCWSHRNLEIGVIATEKIFKLDPFDSGTYVTMFNLHALAGKWEEVAQYRKMMAERNLKKEVSCSWIIVKGKLHRFVVGDSHHPQTEQIYSIKTA
ncbi:hypothetical protein RIF29_29974 [Crotalaria pallida]|uniref:Pentatricopeptide repeat protein n=1 Tax=Crotalaria pallida TaxID=3830 RepID=A0AAN9HWC4_CROPI